MLFFLYELYYYCSNKILRRHYYGKKYESQEILKEIARLKTKLAVLTDVILSNPELKKSYDKITNDKTQMDMYSKTFETEE